MYKSKIYALLVSLLTACSHETNYDHLDMQNLSCSECNMSRPYRIPSICIEGSVTVEIMVNQEGNVEKVTVIDAKPKKAFENTVVSAVEDWKFKPKIVNGKATSQQVKQTIAFKPNKELCQ